MSQLPSQLLMALSAPGSWLEDYGKSIQRGGRMALAQASGLPVPPTQADIEDADNARKREAAIALVKSGINPPVPVTPRYGVPNVSQKTLLGIMSLPGVSGETGVSEEPADSTPAKAAPSVPPMEERSLIPPQTKMTGSVSPSDMSDEAQANLQSASDAAAQTSLPPAGVTTNQPWDDQALRNARMALRARQDLLLRNSGAVTGYRHFGSDSLPMTPEEKAGLDARTNIARMSGPTMSTPALSPENVDPLTAALLALPQVSTTGAAGNRKQLGPGAAGASTADMAMTPMQYAEAVKAWRASPIGAPPGVYVGKPTDQQIANGRDSYANVAAAKAMRAASPDLAGRQAEVQARAIARSGGGPLEMAIAGLVPGAPGFSSTDQVKARQLLRGGGGVMALDRQGLLPSTTSMDPQMRYLIDRQMYGEGPARATLAHQLGMNLEAFRQAGETERTRIQAQSAQEARLQDEFRRYNESITPLVETDAAADLRRQGIVDPTTQQLDVARANARSSRLRQGGWTADGRPLAGTGSVPPPPVANPPGVNTTAGMMDWVHNLGRQYGSPGFLGSMVGWTGTRPAASAIASRLIRDRITNADAIRNIGRAFGSHLNSNFLNAIQNDSGVTSEFLRDLIRGDLSNWTPEQIQQVAGQTWGIRMPSTVNPPTVATK